MIVFALAAGVLWALLIAASFRVYFAVPRLDPTQALASGCPRVGIVIPARDEEAGIERGVRSLLAQQGVDLHVVVVNDGSTDGTRDILGRLAREDPRLQVLHDPPLPEGWLGKVNALHHGAALARGDWLLFTDADVVHHPRALTSAVALAERDGRDLLALMPRFEWETVIEHGLLVAFAIVLVQHGSPHLDDPARPDVAAGSGSFNLVRREAYIRAGGHVPLRTAVLDDLELGRLVKRAGGRVAFRMAPGLVSVRMFRGNRAALWGLSKNVIASFSGRVSVSAAAGLCVAALLLGPPCVALAGAVHGDARLVAAGVGVYLFQLASLAAMRGWHRYRWSRLPAFPLFAATIMLCILSGAYFAMRFGAVEWRGRRVAVGPSHSGGRPGESPRQ